MKKCLRTGKKALSVFMAVLMAITAMVFAAPQKASAANGGYHVRFYVHVNDHWNNNDNEFWFKLAYRYNNGRGSEGAKEAYISDNEVSFWYKKGQDVTVWEGDIPGFPTYIYESCRMYASRTFKYNSYVQVRSTSGVWTTVISSDERSVKGPGGVNKNAWRNTSPAYVGAGHYPYIAQNSTIYTATEVQNIGIPPLGDKKDVAVSVTNPQYYSYDQWGVRYEPTTYSVTGVEGLNLSGGGGNPYNITATTSTTQSKTDIVQNATLHANWVNPSSNQAQHAETTAAFKVYNPRYLITYNANSGVLGTQATYAYGNQKISAETSDAITNNHETLPAEKFPTDGLRAGYTFNGIWSLPSGGIKRGANAIISADDTWYAQWIANKYNAIFKITRGTYPSMPYEYTLATIPTDCDTVPVPPSEIEDYDDGDYHYKYNETWKNSLGVVYEADNLPPMTMNEEGVVYWAQYDREFVEADYSEVERLTALAYKDYINEENYENLYTEESRSRLEASINAVIKGLGRSQQEIVDDYATAIKDAIDAMGRKKFSVVFEDSLDHKVIRFDYPVYYGYSIGYSDSDDIKFPTNTEKDPDRTYHYIFKGWESADSEHALNSVTANMVITANYERVKHNFAEEEFGSTCTSAKGKKYTCTDCGYTYNVYEGGIGDEHDYSDEWTIDLQPTCTTDGIKSHHCKRCGFRTDETKIDKLDHDFDGVESEVIVEVSCENDGVSIKECKRCGFNEYTIEPKTEHEFEVNKVDATCTSKGYTVSECKKCGITLIGSYVDPLGHNFKEVEGENIAASCVGVGYTVSQCENCGLKQYNTSPALGHNWNEEATIDSEATCLKNGQKSIHCSVCGTIKEGTVEVITATGHKLDDGEVLVAQWCNQQGVMIYRCQNEGCGYAETKVSEALDHDMDVVINPATCTEDGSKISTCKRCSTVITEVIGKLGHDFYEGEKHPATCTTSGYTEMICRNDCGETYNVYNENEPATGHAWGDWEVTEPSKNDAPGTMVRYCTVEGCVDEDGNPTSETVEIPAGGHSFDGAVGKTIQESTCAVNGIIEYACTAPGHTGANACGVVAHVAKEKLPHQIVTDYHIPKDCTELATIKTYCKVCDEVFQNIEYQKEAHNFGPWQIKREVTCGKDGINIRFCTVCGSSEEMTVSRTGEHRYTTTPHNPTCVDQGFTVYGCIGCGATFLDNFVPALGHLYGEWTDVAETCTKSGGRQRVCERIKEDGSVCGHIEFEADESRPATGHNLTDWEYVIHPSDKGAYAKRRHCQNGGCTYSEYETGAGADHEIKGVNAYYQVNFYNEWVTDEYETLTQNEIAQNPIAYTKLAKTYKTEKLASIYVLKGTEAEYPGKVPVRGKDIKYGGYDFEGWTNKGFDHALKHEPKEYESSDGVCIDLSNINANTEAYALFRSKDVYYTVCFANPYNNQGSTRLTRDFSILHGHEITFTKDGKPYDYKPSMAENNQVKYEFTGWNYDIAHIYDNVTVIARYNAIKKVYTLVYHDYDGNIIGRESITYGGAAQNIPTVAEKPEDDTYIYRNLNKWTLVDKTTEVNLSNFTSVPENAKEGDEIHIYSKQDKRLKIYKVQFIVLDPYKQNLSGASVQVLDSRGQLAATATTDEKGVANIEITYSSIYTIKISRGNYAIEGTFTLDPSNPGTIKLAKIIGAERTYQSIVKLIDYTDQDMPVDQKCGCVCHTFLSGIWIFTMNLLYQVFKIRHVCCYDMFVVHGDKLKYGSN